MLVIPQVRILIYMTILLYSCEAFVNRSPIKFSEGTILILPIQLRSINGYPNKILLNENYRIILGVDTDCVQCLETLFKWDTFLKDINLCEQISFIVIGYGENQERFKYLLNEFGSFDFPIFFYEGDKFDYDLIIINNDEQILNIDSPFKSIASNAHFINTINKLCVKFISK